MNVIICPWLQGGPIGSDTTSFYQMWSTVVSKYGGSSNFYFDLMNEPLTMSGDQINSTASTWLSTFPSVPRDRVIIPGTGGDQNLCAAGGLCVDDNAASTANGNAIQLYTCNGSSAQDWSVESDGTLRVLGSCMDITGGGTANGTLVQLYTCNGTGAQQWTAKANGSLVNPQSGRCLDDPGGSTANGTQLEIWDCNGGANQEWTLPSL